MAQAANQELVDRFEEFYRRYYSDDIAELARKYPRESKSLHLDWRDLYQMDPDLADDYINHPDDLREAAEEALRLYDLPVDVSLGQAHVRVFGLDEHTEIRAIRAEHLNTLVSVQGMVRKATDVRPKIERAVFVCQRCGAETEVPQGDAGFQEPYQCESCERQGPFKLDPERSEFVDSQKLRIQESPEGLAGGETPQSIDVHVADDITGEVTPGDHVTVSGVLRLDQSEGSNESPVFDLYMEGTSVVIEDEEFDEMNITEEDKQQIVEISNRENIYEQMVDSMAPSIYGHREAKLAMILQLFSGVTKHLPDESRIRGDLHMLLIGDPGTGKCLDGDTHVTLANGTERPIRDIVEENLDDPKSVDDGVYDDIDLPVLSMDADGTLTKRRATRVWKREAPDEMYRIRTSSGRELEVTPSHPLFVQQDGKIEARTADELGTDEFVATPRSLQTSGDDTLDVAYRRAKSENAVRLDLPDEWTPSLTRLVGYIIAEGYVVLNDDNTGDVRVTNEDDEILDDVTDALDNLGLNYAISGPRDGKSAKTVRCTSGEFASFLKNLEPAILQRSADQRVPDAIRRATAETKCAFLRAYIDSEGHVSETQREITVASMSRELLDDVRSLLLAFDITSSVEARNNGSHRLRIGGDSFKRYVEQVGFVTERKSTAAGSYDDQSSNTNVDVVPNIGGELRRIREALEVSQFDCGVPRTTYQHYERGDRNPSRDSLRRVVEAFEDRLAWLREVKQSVEDGDWRDVSAVRNELNVSQAELADEMDVEQTAVSYYERNDAVPDGGKVASAKRGLGARIDEALSVETDVEHLRHLVENDVSWDRIESIETVEPAEEWVYDLEVEGTHAYLSNGVVSHNSALISYVQNIAPRSVYTSGKGSSSAGLTAAAVRDDFGDGQQWTLEAGALVLADQGVAAVDELDKMAADDRSAMHEALEQQKISISKAGINATLKARCSLLGAANPKYGRFDQYEPIGEQIDLEPALISRFDLIFTVTDEPDPEEDAKLARHILQTNYAGELNTQQEQLASANHTEDEVDAQTDTVAPAIDASLLRKYIAYSRRNCYPTMSDEAREAIEDFYVDLRAEGQGEDSPVPVTARQLEALVRLGEASARVRLSDTVEVEDAERVIEIVRSCLQDIGVDPETGEYDADVVETGRSKTQRDRVKNVKAIIKEIEDEFDEGAPVEEVLDRAEEVGMDASKAEHEIEKLKEKGELYQPNKDHLRAI
ncbi:LAGLIDADG family homing endonuclease [Halobacterium sp. KA-6]|uniref:LAGLIDADG family homing endonuclease n=1 Tax=Halobacterium sp. KA-6 TaxID=2896368 RepID=UPI001E518FE0|nr:LAGLIDADG family homing endonuclease [Halobacterium sp. KA-6]MCD2202961.1 helix-turn-helix domain-containing protein [Halobacterium sp. KA-6]